MGQKTHPKIFRLGVIETWDSKWFARHDYPKLLHEDFRIKKFLKSRLYHAGISRIEIERAANKAKINIHTARPGIVIGKKGAEIEKLKEEITKLTQARNVYQHSRGAQTGFRRPTGRGKRRTAIGAPGRFSPGYERKRFSRHAHGRSGRQNPKRGQTGRLRNCADGMVSRRTSAAAYFARRY